MAGTDPTISSEGPADYGTGPTADAKRWIAELDLAEKARRKWKDQAESVIKRYERVTADETDEGNANVRQRKFPLLWSMMETLEPSVFARTPTAVVSRRYKDADPLGRVASEVLERALNFTLESIDFQDIAGNVVKDFLLTARGVGWVRYVPHMRTVDPGLGHNGGPAMDGEPDAEGGEQQASDGQLVDGAEPYDVVDWEEALPDHVAYDDFLTNEARTWAEVRWVSRRTFQTRDELVSRFGDELGAAIPLDHKIEDEDRSTTDTSEMWNKAQIFEIWDKVSRKVLWVSKSYADQTLDERDDPLGLQDFFPCPRPALGTCSPKSIYPIPDYNYYRSQDRDINALTVRIGLLTDALKVRGFYAAGGEQKDKLNDLLSGETNTLIPIDGWRQFQDQGGAEKMIAWLPIDIVANALKACIEARRQLLDDAYQITGMADITRGEVDPNETATATRAKGQWGPTRIRKKQQELQRFIKEWLRLLGQVIASQFSWQTLAAMTNVQLFPDPQAKALVQQQLQVQFAAQAQQGAQAAQVAGVPPPAPPDPPPELARMLAAPTWADVMGLLKDKTLRTFRIDIETDSTIEPNEQEEKASRVEFVTAVSEFVARSMPAVELQPEMLPVIAQSLLFLVRGYRVGREMEDVIEKAMDQLQAKAQAGQSQQKPPQGPNPQAEQMKAQASMVGAQAKMADAKTNEFRAQTDRMEAQAGAQLDGQRIQVEQQGANLDRQADLHMQDQDIQADLQQAVLKGVQRRFIHEMNDDRPLGGPTQ